VTTHTEGAPSEAGEEAEEEEIVVDQGGGQIVTPEDGEAGRRRKFYVDGGAVEIAARLVYELDAEGNQLRVVRLTDYAKEKVRDLFPSAAALRTKWAKAAEREAVLEALEERGIDLEQLREATGQPEADAFDLLCHVVYSSPLRTRRERADDLRREHRDFFESFTPEARAILGEVLEKYAEHGIAQVTDPRILRVPPLSERGTALEIASCFGGASQLRDALEELQRLLYAA
jgi:type I restriction enzyme R subunit